MDEFERLVEAQATPLTRAAYLLTGDRGLAEDLVQSALTKAYLSRSRVLGAASPEAYLRTILVNTHRRRFRRRRVTEHLTAEPPETAAATGDGVEDRRDLVVAVAALPRGQRAVVVLRYLEDRSEAEVASILGCSAGTVKSQSARALAALRRHPALTKETTP